MQRRNIESSAEDFSPAAGAQSPVHNAPVPATNLMNEQQNSGIQDDTPPPSYSELFGNNHQSTALQEGIINYCASSNT